MLLLLVFSLWGLLASRSYSQLNFEKVQRENAKLRWISEKQQLVRQLQTTASSLENPQQDSLISTATDTANQHGIRLKQYRPLEEHGIQISIEHSRFSNLLQWMDLLSIEHDLVARSLSITRSDQAGYCNVHIEFVTSGATST